jgi:hypothetical protein
MKIESVEHVILLEGVDSRLGETRRFLKMDGRRPARESVGEDRPRKTVFELHQNHVVIIPVMLLVADSKCFPLKSHRNCRPLG